MKRLFPFIGIMLIGLLIAQPVPTNNFTGSVYVRSFDLVANMLRWIPARSEYVAMTKGYDSLTNRSGAAYFYDPTATNIADGVEVLQPLFVTGRIFKIAMNQVTNTTYITNTVGGGGSGLNVQTFDSPGDHTWTNPPGALLSYVMVVGGGSGGGGGGVSDIDDVTVGATTVTGDGGLAGAANTNGFNPVEGPYTRQLNATPTILNWSNALVFPKFPASIGTLKGVTIDFQSSLFGSTRAQTTSAVPVSAVTTFSANYLLVRTNGTSFHTNTVLDFSTNALSAHPMPGGICDFMGASSVTIFWGVRSTNNILSYTNADPDLAMFSGSGDVSLGITATNASAVSLSDGSTPCVQFFSAAGANNSANTLILVTYYFLRNSLIGDVVWRDLNTNGIVNTNEYGITNVTVNLVNTNGTAVSGISPLLTDINGVYLFTNVPPGEYYVTSNPGTNDLAVYDKDGGNFTNTLITVVIGVDQVDIDYGFIYRSFPYTYSGDGGAGGGTTEAYIPSGTLPSTVSVRVGAGSTGGAGSVTARTNGTPASAAGESYFGSLAVAGGAHGFTNVGSGQIDGGLGTQGQPTDYLTVSNAYGASKQAVGGAAGGTLYNVANAGTGEGGGVTTAPAFGLKVIPRTLYQAVGTNGGYYELFSSGGGASGGGGTTLDLGMASNAGNGGNGGYPGGGGGGGGLGLYKSGSKRGNGGNGGDGGNGFVSIITVIAP